MPIRPRVLWHYLGELALVVSVLSAVPALMAWVLGNPEFGGLIFGIAVLPSLILALGCRLSLPGGPLQPNEAMTITAIAFLLVAVLMSVPFNFAGLPYVDALFESVSGITTTGLTVTGSIAALDPSVLFLRAWLQFCGGFGFAVLAVALLAGHGAETRRLMEPTAVEEDLAVSTRLHGRHLLKVYLTMTVVGVAALWLLGLDFFNAVLHALAAVSTGGFSGYDDSLTAMPVGARYGTSVISLAAALPLILFYRSLTQRQSLLLWGDPEFRSLVLGVSLVAVLLYLTDALSPQDAFLQSVNAQTTTGFSSVDLSGLSPAGKLVLILSMLTGAGMGSTGGGLKLLRVLILFRLVQLLVQRAALPRHAVTGIRIGGANVEDDQILRAVGVVLLYLGLIVLSWLIFVAAGLDPMNSLFDVVSATATVGLSSGITSPELSPWLKAVLCVDMLAGRLEILALVVMLYPPNWLRTR